MVFAGNINQSIDVLLKTSHLFQPFPEEMAYDSAFFDRMHFYIPGWEVPKFSPKHFTDEYGFITDYIAEFFRVMRKYNYSDAFDRYFKLGTSLNQRDTTAVRKTVSGLVKILYPNGEFTKDEIEKILVYALEGRRRVKEQLKKIGGMEFYAVNFSYIDNETFEEKFVSVPEQSSDKLIPDGIQKDGTVHTIGRSESGVFGVYRIENQSISGNGKITKSGLNSKEGKESVEVAINYFKANKQHISSLINLSITDYMLDIRDLQGVGQCKDLSVATLIAMASSSLRKPTLPKLAIIGSMTTGGTISKVEELANTLQVAHDAGATRILLPANAMSNLTDVPSDLFTKFQVIFYSNPEDAIFKALAIE